MGKPMKHQTKFPEKGIVPVIGDGPVTVQQNLDEAFAEGAEKARMPQVECKKDLRNGRRSPKK
jgi:hypothetical protein